MHHNTNDKARNEQHDLWCLNARVTSVVAKGNHFIVVMGNNTCYFSNSVSISFRITEKLFRKANETLKQNCDCKKLQML